MKILIIGHHRSGTTSLLNALGKGFNNSKVLFEPYNDPNFIKGHKNHISLLNSSPSHIIEKNLIVSPFGIFEKNLEFYFNYIKHFDKIILVYRENIIETAQSYKQDNYHKSLYPSQPEKCHTSYQIDPQQIQDISEEIQIVKNWHSSLKYFSDRTKIPLISYEDLYSGNIDFLKIFLKIYDINLDNPGLFYEILNPKNRYRQN